MRHAVVTRDALNMVLVSCTNSGLTFLKQFFFPGLCEVPTFQRRAGAYMRVGVT
jgi:hypothetical protein